MKNIIVNKITAVFLTLIIIFGLIPSMGFAQPNPPSPLNEVKGFNMSVFDSHFSKADREINPERWLVNAKTGITQAVYAWELIAFSMYENPFEFEEAKARLEDWSNKELEARFSQWLIKRFFGETLGKALSDFSAMIGENQKKYTWHLDEEGNVVFAERTGDPLVIRPGEEGREFSQDWIIWRNETDGLIEKNSGAFDAVMINMYPELLAYIPSELRETMSTAIREAGAAASVNLKREFENIAAREQRIFTSRRTRDIWSLRKKSDDEAARIFTEKLITETEQICARGIEDLNTRIEQAYAGTGDMTLIGEEWLQLYKEQFDRGLKAWEEAEERFFIRRIEWEQDSYRLFSEGEETWLSAFDKLNEEYQKWELNAKKLFDTGEQLFKNLSSNLEKSIADAKAEFEINKNMRVGTGTEKVKALIDMYITGASAAITAKENVQYWLDYYQIEKNVNDPDFEEWLSNNQNNRKEDIKKHYNLYTSYLEIALDARDRIISDYAELLGKNVLKDILSPDASTDDFYLDEYQLALVRAKTLVLYWERKTSIAQAVISYSEKIDAGRMTEAESIQAWETAKDAYNQSLALYETELNKLSEIGLNIQDQRIILDELAKKMSEDEEKLSRLSREHSMLVAGSYSSIGSVVNMDFNNIYNFIADEYKYFLKTGDSASYKDVLNYGMNWSIAQQREEAEKLLAIFINGDNSDTPPLADIKDEVLLKTILAAIDLIADSTAGSADYKLRSVDSSYSGADWYSKAKGIVFSGKEKADLYGEKLGEQLAVDLNDSYRTLLEKRFDFELKTLKSILETNTGTKDKNDAMSKVILINLEDVLYTYNILLNLKERLYSNKNIYTDDYEENTVIEYFISLGSFCNDTKRELIDYYNDYYYCSNLLDLYFNYASISSFWQKETWQNSRNYIKTFLADYGLAAEEQFLPDSQSIYEAILSKGGNIKENVILFFDEFEKYFTMVPEWLGNEYFFWKNAVVDYIAANIISDDELNYEKNWRQFICLDDIKKLDPDLTGVSTTKEGIIEDARFAAVYYTNRLNDAIDLFSQKNISVSTQTAQTLYNYYSYASSDLDNRLYSLSFYYNDMSRLGRALEISKLNQSDMEAESKIIYNALKIQEEKFNLSRNDYFTAAENFMNIGSLYDGQYKTVKKAYNDTEVKRFEYEKEDAIRRWASTAYLNTDTINYNDCKNNLEKAETALAVLLEINNKEKKDYINPEYNALYREYEQSFERKIKALEALENVSSALLQEYNYNESCFNNYQYYLLDFGELSSVKDYKDWQYKDIITVKDGKLAFSANSSWKITANSDNTEIDIFFNSLKIIDGERHEISPFEEALKGLSERMSVYLNDPNKLKQWSLAREYLIKQLCNNNSNLPYLNKYLAGLGEIGRGGSLENELYKTAVTNSPKTLNHLVEYYDIYYAGIGSSFYGSLSETEKADLEFYLILTLTGKGNDNISGFQKMLNLELYQMTFNMVSNNYIFASNQSSKWYTLFFYDEMKAINLNTLFRILPVLNQTRINVNNFINKVNNDIKMIQKYSNEYFISCNNIKTLIGEKEAGQSVVWNDIDNALTITGKFKSEDIDILKTSWDKMQEKSPALFENLNEALTGLFRWTKSEETRLRNDLEKIWLAETQKQQKNESNYLDALEAYFSGTGNINALKTAAENAYGKNSAVQKDHIENIYSVLLSDLSLYLTMDSDHYSEFASLGHDIQLITEKTLKNRYAAELEARNIEWKQMQTDILVKANEWQNSVSLILEKGRSEWEAGKQKMNESYKQWNTNFQNEVRRIENEWLEVYLAGLEDKEKWLEQTSSAFNQASAESLLQLVGMEGERLSRFMDVREPFDIRNAVPEAQAIMKDLLQSSGIVNMTNAFSYMNNIADTAALSVRKGLGGVSSWEAAVVKTAAKDIAKKTNAEISDAEARKLAYNAEKTVGEAISNLNSIVNDANNSFRESMDNQFIMEGLWRKNGTNYEKDIVKGSTLFHPVISTKQIIEGYRNYIMEPVSLKTNLDENFLSTLNTFAIRVLIDNAYNEVKTITEDIFGDSKKKLLIEKKGLDNREQAPGKFGAHIGYEPAVKPYTYFGDTRESIFYDEGKGELGRLFSNFIYWKVIDAKGSAEIGLPPWEKRMWNDENSKFSSPSLKQAAQVAGAVVSAVVAVAFAYHSGGASLGLLAASAALIAGINSSSNVLFSTLNYAYGYQSFKEAGFDILKTSAINYTSAFISGAFGNDGGLISSAVGTASSTAGQIATHTVMAGLQTATSSAATNALNSFTYEDGHIGWSKDIFLSGMRGIGVDILSSMVSTYTTQTLTEINSGLDSKKIIGFNNGNRIDMVKFNNLAGSIAGQGIYYAFGDDFTVNLLDISMFRDMFSNEKIHENEYHSGLLELHLGRDGASMNLGTGGANISIDNLFSAFKGLQVWDVNSRISRFIKNENDFDSAIALRTQYGFGDDRQKGQLWDILNGSAIINTDTEGKFGAESVMNENGKKVINLSGYEDGMSVEDQLLIGILLGHEAYRDGYVTVDNYQETRTATLMHTEMAIRMIQGGYLSVFNSNDSLLRDIVVYSLGEDLFNDYVDKKYDSSDDFWKLLRDGTLVFNNDGWLVDETGKQLYNAEGKPIGSKGIETGLLNILFGGTSGVTKYTDEQVRFAQKLMTDAGIKHTATDENDISTYNWKDKNWNKNTPIQSLNMQNIMENVGSIVAAQVFARYYESTAIASIAETLGKETSSLKINKVTDDALSRFTDTLVPAILDFYSSMRNFFDASTNFQVSGKHGAIDPKYVYKNYENNAHFGTDFANGKSGDSIYLGIAGKVVLTAAEEKPGEGNGNWMVVEYGYKLDGSYIGMGIFGEYLHMQKKPGFADGTYLNSSQKIGTVGNTGNSDGAHLHYSIYTLKEDTYSLAALNMILNNEISNKVISREAKYYAGTYSKYASKKVTYNIENFINGLKK